MVEGDRDGWVVLASIGQIRAAIVNGLKKSDPAVRQAARELADVLVARGHAVFKKLLEP
jgi:hypothetical protein